MMLDILLFFQYNGLKNLIQRNERLYGTENAPSGGVALPFILVQVRTNVFFLLFWYIFFIFFNVYYHSY